jgi:sulfatase maturation enzyme AslB (radical SAM superfamily)
MQTDNGAMCLLPWDSIAIRAGGRAEPCCRFWPSTEFLEGSKVSIDFRKSTPWRELQEDMLAGKKNTACQQCYKQEDAGGMSTRTYSLQDTELPTTTELRHIKMLDIAFSNLCNLACVSCSRQYSTTWGTEDYKAGRIGKEIKVLIDHPTSIVDNLDLSQLTTLKIFGGEPFMDQDRFIHLMKKLDLSKIKLLVSTNGTSLPNSELKSLMDQCASIYLDVSLDGLGSVNDWYRWPSKFTEVQQVMDQYNEWWGTKDNVTLTIHSVISVYNIFTLDQFIMFMTNNYPKWELDWDWVSGREWQMLSIIPPNQKILLTRQLTEWESTIQGNWNIDKGNPFKRSIVELLKTPKSDIKEFWERSVSLAKERNLDILKMVPDITRLLEDSVDNAPE